MVNIVGNKKIWFTISGILIALALIAIVGFGFKQSAEFQGGTLWEFKVPTETPSIQDVQNFFTNALHVSDASVNLDEGSGIYLVRFGAIDEQAHQSYLVGLKNKWPSFAESSFESIGPSVGAGLKQNAILAIIFVLIGISLYIAFAFRKASRPVSSWKYGWITLFTLFHDVVIPAGLLAFLGHTQNIQIDSNFVVALLVVMGFSVHDTIVVFDRIRENLLNQKGKKSFAEVVNESVNQTLARSVNTSFTLILVLLALYLVGPVNLSYFVLTLLVGVVTGIYSSIFIASPTLVATSGKSVA